MAQTELEISEPAASPADGVPERESRRSRAVLIRPAVSWPRLDARELWHYRELAATFVWRDLKVRYKQTFIGVGWAIFQPFLSMVIFTLVLGKFGKGFKHTGLETVPVFILSGLIVWQYFSSAVAVAGGSITGNTNLVTKVYFPRVLIPLAAVLVPVVDFMLAFTVLVGVTVYYGEPVDGPVWPAPFFLLLAVATALGGGLLIAPANVRYRDIPYAVPYLLQMAMWVSAVFYPITTLPTYAQWIYALNPMNAAITGFRWALYGSPAPVLGQTLVSIACAIIIFVLGLAFFRRSEPRFADMI